MLRRLAVLAAWSHALDAPPSFIVDLSQPPGDRWSGAVQRVLDRHPYEYSFQPVFANHAPLFDGLTSHQQLGIAAAVDKHFPETAEELRGIAAQFATVGHNEVTYEYLTLWLYFHELAHTDLPSVSSVETRECTAVVVRTKSGAVLHGGNMDQSPPAARNLTLRVKFVDGKGHTVFEGVDWYTLLSTGVSRAVRQGLATVQEDWRTSTRPLGDVLADIDAGVTSQMLVFRTLFTTAHSSGMTWAEFLGNVSSNRLAAQYYVITSGPNPDEGAVIARNLLGADRIDRFVDAAALSRPDDYFLVQTNYDRWLPDEASDPRRTAAEVTLRRLGAGEGTSLLGLLAVTSTYPVHNPHSAYTALMDSATGELHAYVREAMCPVDPQASVVTGETRYCTAGPRPASWPEWLAARLAVGGLLDGR